MTAAGSLSAVLRVTPAKQEILRLRSRFRSPCAQDDRSGLPLRSRPL